jgi:hypothetical protein
VEDGFGVTVHRWAFFLLVVGVRVAPVRAQALTAPLRLSAGVFGLTNTTGSEIVVLDSLAAPGGIHVALCGDSPAYAVAFTRHQTAPPDVYAQPVAANFAKLAGDVFGVQRARARPDQTCYLTGDSTLVTTRVRFDSTAQADCGPALGHRLMAVRHRRLRHCWPMADAAGVRVVAAQFVPVDTIALASLVVVTATQLLFEDFPARYDGPGSTPTWRVDDEGIFSPEPFAILLTWAGAEGEDAFLLVADSANAFRQVQMTYRYWSPE